MLAFPFDNDFLSLSNQLYGIQIVMRLARYVTGVLAFLWQSIHVALSCHSVGLGNRGDLLGWLDAVAALGFEDDLGATAWLDQRAAFECQLV